MDGLSLGPYCVTCCRVPYITEVSGSRQVWAHITKAHDSKLDLNLKDSDSGLGFMVGL